MKDLASRHLLHLDSGHHDGVTWPDFLFAFDISLAASERGRIYNNYILVLHAAIAGEGIALGWEHVVVPLLQNRKLISPLDMSFSSESDFYVVARKGQKLGTKAQAVWDWLISSSSQACLRPGRRKPSTSETGGWVPVALKYDKNTRV